jgi:hypothetical protein
VDHDAAPNETPVAEVERLRAELEAARQIIEAAAHRAAKMAGFDPAGMPGESATELLLRMLDELEDHFDGCTGGDWRDS